MVWLLTNLSWLVDDGDIDYPADFRFPTDVVDFLSRYGYSGRPLFTLRTRLPQLRYLRFLLVQNYGNVIIIYLIQHQLLFSKISYSN